MSTYGYAENQPTTLTDPSGLGAVGNVCTSFKCWLNQTATGKCVKGIGEGAVISAVSVGTPSSAALRTAGTGCLVGIGTHVLGEATNDDAEELTDGAVNLYEVSQAYKTAARRREEERLAREAARRSRGVIVVVRRITTLIIIR